MQYLKELLFLQHIKGIGVTKINNQYAQWLNTLSGLEDLSKIVLQSEKKITSEIVREARTAAEESYDSILSDTAIKPITIYDEDYPNKLNSLKNKKPVIVYIKGDERVFHRQTISVVGTREPCEKTVNAGKAIVQKLVTISNPVIVSGLAIGCDAVAHQATLDANGTTLAVLPGGLNNIAPSSHNKLAQNILEKGGCLLSEYEPNVAPNKFNFIRRDALIAALSDATMVLECRAESGTMHTVDTSLELNLPVASYFPDDRTEAFSGNELIISKGGYKITKHSDLNAFLKLV